jgi:predicted lipoprotein with Yx(FWY)xxD motif
MRSNSLAVVAVGAVAAIAAAGCGSSSSSSSSSPSTSAGGGGASGGASTKTTSAPSTGGATAAVVKTGVTNNSKIGSKAVLVDSKGLTLYWFEKDKKGTTKSACNGSCASVWPPLTTTGKATVSGAAMASNLGTIKRSDGTTQVTYAGFPLYTYMLDKKPGDAVGNDIKSFGASWYALTPAGAQASG